MKRSKSIYGFTLIEVMMALALTTITVLGTINMHMLATRNAVIADGYSSGSRVIQVLLETWHASAALGSFNPVTNLQGETTDFVIATDTNGPVAESGLTTLGHYLIRSNGKSYYSTLAYQAATDTTPALMAVGLSWRPDFQTGDLFAGSETIWLTSYQ